MKVVLKKWLKKNKAHVALWLVMGLATLGLTIYELGIYTIVAILPFLPLFIVVLIRMAQEWRR